MTKTKYEITDKAGPYVAGKRVNGKKTIDLAEAEARHELQLGTIRAPRPASKPADKPAAKTASKDD